MTRYFNKQKGGSTYSRKRLYQQKNHVFYFLGKDQLRNQHSALIQNISDVLEGKGKGRGKGSSRGEGVRGRGRGRGGKSRTEDDTSLQDNDDSMNPGK